MKRLIVFFWLHFFVIITSSIYLTKVAYFQIKQPGKVVSLPVIDQLYNNVYSQTWFGGYLILSGTNTGYGFYGMNVATEKFFDLDVFDADNKVIYSTDNFGFRSLVAKTRYESFPTKVSNFISETEGLKRKPSPDTLLIKVREDYVYKLAKYIGKIVAQRVRGGRSYQITFNALVPVNIWKNEHIVKNKVFKEKIFRFDL